MANADDDVEARHLIEYLGWNRPELFADRLNHIRRIRELRSFFAGRPQEFLDYLRLHPGDLSFATALEAELGLDLSGIL